MRTGAVILLLAAVAHGEEPEEGKQPVPFEWRQLGGSATHVDTREPTNEVVVPKVLWHCRQAVGQPTILKGWIYCGGPVLGRIDADTGKFERSPLADERLVGPTPILTDDLVIVRRPEGQLEAYSPDLHRRIWQSQGGAPNHFVGQPPVWHGPLVVVNGYKAVVAYRVQDGKPLWRFSMGQRGVPMTPAIADGRVFFGSDLGGTWALDVTSGRELWHAPGRGQFRLANPVVAGSVLVMADHGVDSGEKPWRTGELQFIDVASGTVRWKLPTGEKWCGTPCVSNGRVLVGTRGQVLQFDAKSHKALAPRIAVDGAALSTPAIVGSTLYSGTTDGFMYAHDLRTGALLWRLQFPGDRAKSIAPQVRSIVHTGTRIYVETTNGLYCLGQDPNRRGGRPQNLTITAPD